VLAKFQKHIENQFPELREKNFLLACSGGLDSVVLAQLCHKSNLDFHMAHCNFNLRGTESDGDEGFVKKLTTELDSKLFVTHFDTIGYVNKNKVSIEMAARELRYAWFTEIMKENALETLVTAHHADDSLETFLINLSRGTGIDGLKGIPSKISVIVRPLLHFSREEILTYAQDQKLDWREDRTNQDTVFLRNKVRHELVPKLKELHPSFLKNFQKTQSYLTDSAQMLSDYVVLLKSQLFIAHNGLIRIPIDKLAALHPRRTYLYELFKTYGFRAWDDIDALLEGMSGKEVRSQTHRLVKDREYLLLEEFTSEKEQNYLIPEGVDDTEIPLKLKIEEVDSIYETSENILYVDKSTLKYPMVVRKWKKGDYFYPFGMTGKKKLSKYFKDEKIDVISKERQWLLCSGEDIVWIIGKRGDNRFKVTENTKKILRFTWIE
jgi:tRNA(Ile)-lysidine synthase